MNKEKISIITQKILLGLIVFEFILSAITSFSFAWSDIPLIGWADIVLFFIGYLLAFYLIYKKNWAGGILVILLAYESFSSAYALNLKLSLWLLKTGPSVFCSLVLSLLFMLFGAIYILVELAKRFQKK